MKLWYCVYFKILKRIRFKISHGNIVQTYKAIFYKLSISNLKLFTFKVQIKLFYMTLLHKNVII